MLAKSIIAGVVAVASLAVGVLVKEHTGLPVWEILMILGNVLSLYIGVSIIAMGKVEFKKQVMGILSTLTAWAVYSATVFEVI